MAIPLFRKNGTAIGSIQLESMTMFKISVITILFIYSVQATAQHRVMKLWPANVPNQTYSTGGEIITTGRNMRVRNVQEPALHVYLPSENIATGRAILLFPGGGYYHMAFEKEGTDVAKWLNGHGIAGIVVKYRLPSTSNLLEGHKAPLQDAQRALRLVRSMAEEWHIDQNQIGVMGFSAGGHLAGTLATQFQSMVYSPSDKVDEVSAHPNFAVLLYPVISMKEGHTHEDSRQNLIGENMSEEFILHYSLEEQVTEGRHRSFWCILLMMPWFPLPMQ